MPSTSKLSPPTAPDWNTCIASELPVAAAVYEIGASRCHAAPATAHVVRSPSNTFADDHSLNRRHTVRPGTSLLIHAEVPYTVPALVEDTGRGTAYSQ